MRISKGLPAANAQRVHARSSFEAFSIAVFALTFGCACVATFVLVVVGAGAESPDHLRVDQIAWFVDSEGREHNPAAFVAEFDAAFAADIGRPVTGRTVVVDGAGPTP